MLYGHLYLVIESNNLPIRVKDVRSRYANKVFELLRGIEPRYLGYKASVSPTILKKQMRSMRDSNPLRAGRQPDILSIWPIDHYLERINRLELLSKDWKSPMLAFTPYSQFVGIERFELTAFRVSGDCSTVELYSVFLFPLRDSNTASQIKSLVHPPIMFRGNRFLLPHYWE